ncbi:hypothetical protein H0H81_009346, partial [Sphagnurus paluster]
MGEIREDMAVEDFLEARPSSYALTKIGNGEYVELWYFSPEGCADAQRSTRTDADDTYGISRMGEMVTLRSVASVQASKRVVQDADITWDQFSFGYKSFIKYISRAGWPVTHVQALLKFFVQLESSRYLQRPNGQATVLTYQARVRRQWMDNIKANNPAEAPIFNIAWINDRLMQEMHAELKDKADAAMQQK